MMQITIALAGNPNSGKTTLFNALTGSSQYVGNWPGVTVEKKEGRLKGHPDVYIADLPGVYSLSPYTLEEVVARNFLLDGNPDVLLNIIDGTNLERNLYLTTQLIELGKPVVACINMIDVIEKNGNKINTKQLSKQLGCEVVEISALRGTGVVQAAEAAITAAKHEFAKPRLNFSGSIVKALAHIEKLALYELPEGQQRFFSIKLFERDEKTRERLCLSKAIIDQIEGDIQSCEAELDDDAESLIIAERYSAISSIISSCVDRKNQGKLSASDKIDRIVTNRIFALPIFAAVMFLVYYISMVTIGSWVSNWTNDIFFGEIVQSNLKAFLENFGVRNWLVSLLADGIVGGVGAVIGFVPQLLVLFLMLSALEDCGYMARVAFIMDRIFRRFGLSGKSFIPMLVGSGCGIPGIMASRTIEEDRDRKITIITTTFIPCGAKMPIVLMIAGALFSGVWWVAPSAYFVGVAAILISGIILKKAKIFSGDPAPFVMELPAYHVPTAANILRSTWERGWSFIKRAGTVILIASVLIWVASNTGFSEGNFGIVDNEDQSILAVIGSTIAVIFTPLGFGFWQAAVATIMGLVAKEEVVGVFGSLFGVSDKAVELLEGGNFASMPAIAAYFTPLSAYSFLIFNLLCAPCFAAIGAIKREMNSMKWTLFAVGYQCSFAYAVSLCVYQLGMFFMIKQFTIGTAAAVAILAVFAYLIFRTSRESMHLSQTQRLAERS